MDASPPIQNRRFDRSKVMLKATLATPNASLDVTLRNLSCEGALVQAEHLPEAGTRVLFHRQGLSVPSRVAWAHAGHAGVEFEFPLFPGELLRHVPSIGRKAPPPIKKRPGFAPQPLSEAERLLIERWATEGTNTLGN
jgi:hypothetical protein